MAIRTPLLDDRSYAQLRDELIARIPVYSPDWTDHQPSDPGITLLELFAYLGENLLYRFNQIPDATKSRSSTCCTSRCSRLSRPPVTCGSSRRTRSGHRDSSPSASQVAAGDVQFQTLDEVQVWPVEAHAAIRRAPTEALDPDATEYVSRSAGAVGRALADVATYTTVFGAKDPMRPGGDTLDPSTAIEDTVFVALLGDPAVPLAGMAGKTLAIGFVPAAEVPSMVARAETPCPGVGDLPSSPAMQWQICTCKARPDAPNPRTADPVWLDVDVVGDTTAGLTVPGAVSLRLPNPLDDVGLYEPDDPDAKGSGDQPPLVENDEIEERLLAWMRVFRPRGGTIPAFEWLDTNATRVEQAVVAGAEFVGTGTGDPSQRNSLVHGNVLGDVDFEVEEIGAPSWVAWTTVSDFSGSGVDDRHVVIDAEAGTVTCGDGRRGRVWQIGERLRVRGYRHGGGTAGNVAAGAISTVKSSAPNVGAVSNPLPTRGGADAEGLAAGIDRIPAEFRRHDRAVDGVGLSGTGRRDTGCGHRTGRDAASLPPTDPRRRRTRCGVGRRVARQRSTEPERPAARPTCARRGLSASRRTTVGDHRALRDSSDVSAHRRLRRYRHTARVRDRERPPMGRARAPTVPRSATAVRPFRPGLATRAPCLRARTGGRRAAGRRRRVPRPRSAAGLGLSGCTPHFGAAS